MQTYLMQNIYSLLIQINSKVGALQAQVSAMEDRLKCRIDARAAELAAQIAASEQRILDAIARLEAAVIPPPAERVIFYQLIGGVLQEISNMQLKVDQAATIVAKPVDQFGNAAEIEAGSGAWAVTDPALGAIVPDAADPLKAVFTPAGPVGSLMIQFNADADLGQGVKTIAGELPVDLLPGEAVAIQLSAQ